MANINSPIPTIPITPPPNPMQFGQQTHDILSNAIPGLDKLSTGASGVVNNLLSGLPSPSVAQRSNAFFGQGSGMPGSDFVRNRGFDLYGQQADQYRQRGFDDFLNLLKGTSGTVAPTPGEQSQNEQFGKNLEQRQREANIGVQQSNYNINNSRRGDNAVWTSDKQGNTYNRSGVRVGFDPAFVIQDKIGF